MEIISHGDTVTLCIRFNDLSRRYDSRNDGYNLIAVAEAAILQRDMKVERKSGSKKE